MLMDRPDALAKQIQLQLSDIKHWPEEVHDQSSANVVEDRPLKDGKSFWEAGWREKVGVSCLFCTLLI